MYSWAPAQTFPVRLKGTGQSDLPIQTPRGDCRMLSHDMALILRH